MIPGTIAWEDPLTTVPAAGRATYRWTFTPDDTMHYLSASNTIHFSVDKATPTGAPTYTAITAGGKTLADAALTANASWPSGTVQWVDKDGQPVKDKASTACVVADATACCAEGIEFVCGDGSVYPQDYPEIGTEITVTGTFQIDEEEGFTWYYLADAEMNQG